MEAQGKQIYHLIGDLKALLPRPQSDSLRPGEMAVMQSLVRYTRKYPQENKGMKTSDISTELGISPSSLTFFLNHLESRGYVERVPSKKDRRTVLVSLSSKGAEGYHKLTREGEERCLWLARQLGETDTKELIRLLGRICEILEEERE